ncbi:hypothetical protein GFS60_03644 [Rhodococcus sp. WAY2]|nr:hypothetical protein GFS60_03644 [Rhodococcus sp. WAY2]
MTHGQSPVTARRSSCHRIRAARHRLEKSAHRQPSLDGRHASIYR